MHVPSHRGRCRLKISLLCTLNYTNSLVNEDSFFTNFTSIAFQKVLIPHSTQTLDAVGSWQIILPMPNLEGPYKSDKGSEAVLKCLQYKRCAGPQKVSKFRF